MRLIRTEKSNKFCGPAALALITGKPVDEMVLAVKQNRIEEQGIRGYRPVKGMYNGEMHEVLTAQGFRLVPIQTTGWNSIFRCVVNVKPTLAGWLRIHKGLRQRRPDAAILINVTGHYVVLHGRKIYDNHNPEGVWLRQYRHRRVRVKHAWLCEKEESHG